MAVGINTGPMVVGNMGSRARLAYTAVGDAVNVAARLEGLSKEYGVRVVIGEATREAAGPAFEYRFLDVVAVKGRNTPVTVYELLGRAGSLTPDAAALLARYHEGIALLPRPPVARGGRALRRARRRRRPTTVPSPSTAGGATISSPIRRRPTGTACTSRGPSSPG